MTDHRRRLGAAGEAAIARRYEQAGYEVLERNWRCREGEIDLILRRGRVLVFCEVKTRSSAAFGTPADAVTPAKQAQVRRVARRYLDRTRLRFGQIRFDVGSVTPGATSIIEAAF
ncbi:MAG: YraN family protein [Actinomycetota bacterium]